MSAPKTEPTAAAKAAHEQVFRDIYGPGWGRVHGRGPDGEMCPFPLHVALGYDDPTCTCTPKEPT